MSLPHVTIAQSRLMLENPHNCTDMDDALTVLKAVCDALVRRTADGFVPALAMSWDVSDDARPWTFTLRAGVQFHDGTLCDAAAVIATLIRMARPDVGVTLGASGVCAQYLKGAEFDAPDPLTVRIALAHPMAHLLDLLVYGYVASPACLDDPVADPVGTGPHAIVSVTATEIIARSNPGHLAHTPKFASVTWRHVPDGADRLAAFESGDVQVANRLPVGRRGRRITCRPRPSSICSPPTGHWLTRGCAGP